MLRACGLTPISGTFCHPLEVFQIDATKIARRVVAKIRPGAIIIFHDGFDGRTGNRAETARAVRLTIDALRDRGFGFVTVDELLRVPAYRSSGPLD
jgi:peptidoglycan/xylan/chitin deacetylase (PgdA/CDA1 family)